MTDDPLEQPLLDANPTEAGGEGRPNPLLELVGPFYDAAGATRCLGVDAEALTAEQADGGVLGMRTSDGVWVFPAWQFAEAGGVHPELRAVVRALRRLDGWSAGVWLNSVHIDLNGLTPRQALAAGVDPCDVAQLATQDAHRMTS